MPRKSLEQTHFINTALHPSLAPVWSGDSWTYCYVSSERDLSVSSLSVVLPAGSILDSVQYRCGDHAVTALFYHF